MPKAKASLLIILTTAMTAAVLFSLPYAPAIKVQTAIVQKGDLLRSTVLTATVGYARQQLCVAAKDARMAQVLVSSGQQVRKDELLFRLDTSQEEKALASLAQSRYRVSQLDDAVAALAAAQEAELYQAEQEMRLMIEASQVRAEMDGIVETVYVQPGGFVQQESILGIIRSQQKSIVAQLPSLARHYAPGAAAVIRRNGQTIGSARLERLELSASDASTGQQAVFLPVDHALDDLEVGTVVTVDLVEEQVSQTALIPLAAVSEDALVWYVEDGKAKVAAIDVSKRNESYVASTSEWLERHVILLPDAYALYDGCKVKEAKHR